MIAGIDQQADISIYLNPEEVNKLAGGQNIAGILIRRHWPESQGTINVQVDTTKENLNGFGIGIEPHNYWELTDGFQMDVFIGDIYFNRLRQLGHTSLRHDLKDGGKIGIYSESTFETRMVVDELNFFRDNKEKLQLLHQSK
jgi:hypothetical protein